MKKIWKVWTVILVVAATVLLTISTQYSKKEEISTDSYQYLIGVSLPNVIEPWLNNFVDVFTEKVSQDKKNKCNFSRCSWKSGKTDSGY